MIAPFDLAAMDELKEALPRFAHKPLSHLSYLRPEQVEGYWLDDIAQELTNECSTAFASYAEDRINGLVLYGDSPWDTKVVGEPVAVIKYLVGTGAEDSRVLDQLLDEVTTACRQSWHPSSDVQSSAPSICGDSCAGAAWVPAHGHASRFSL